jgi:phosphatidylethanolamine N-methyltransferase
MNVKHRLIVVQEFFNKTITKLANGNALYGCYGLAVSIFTAGIIRDYM